MVQEKREISLKRPNGTWAGQSDQSYFGPTDGAFERLTNCYVSQDGTEIRRMPPLTLWADPQLTQAPTGITAMTPGTHTLVTFAIPHRLPETSSAFLEYRVYVELNGAIPDGWYGVARVTDTDALLNVATTSSSTLGNWRIERATIVHGMRSVGNRLSIVAETLTNYIPYFGVDLPKRTVATWVQSRDIDWRSPIAQFSYWSNPLNEPDQVVTVPAKITTVGTVVISQHGYGLVGDHFPVIVAGFAARGIPDGAHDATVVDPYTTFSVGLSISGAMSDTDGTVTYPFQAFNRPIRRKCQLDVADGRLLIATPGEGIVFHANVAYLDASLTVIPKRTKLLGLPKGQLGSVTVINNGGLGTLAAGDYWVGIGYHDTRTNDYGLISELLQVTVGAAPTNSLSINVKTGRAALREVYGASIVVFLSDPNTGPGTMRQVLEVEPPAQFISFNYNILVNSLAPISNRVPIIENMPLGCSAIRTVKGTTFFSGQMSSVPGSIISAEIVYTSIERSAVNEITFSPTSNPTSDGAGITAVSGGMAADYEIPSSAGGLGILINGLPTSLLDKQLNPTGFTYGGGPTTVLHNHQWSITTVHPASTAAYLPRSTLVTVQRGMVWFSEQGFPGVSPSTNRIPVDRIEGFDIIALGRMGDVLIMCTDRETYSLVWDRSPLGVNPRMVSTEYGCVAASSMCQFDGGLAWISARGPVVLGPGGFEWISNPISGLWDTYKRDSRGWMPHAFASHDPVRKLLLFFVRKDRNNTRYDSADGDDAKSKVPCDDVLVYSYAAGSWSVWELKPEHECVDSSLVMCYDGIRRLGILTFSKLLYLWDETLRDTQELVEVRIETKSNLTATTNTPLERATKVGAVSLRVDGGQLFPDKPEVGYLCEAKAFDDLRKETFIATVEPATQNRTRLSFGAVRSQEFKLSLRMVGVGPLRIKDIAVEVSPGG